MVWWQFVNDNPVYSMAYILIAVIFAAWCVDRVCKHIGKALRIRVQQVWLERVR